MTTKTTKTNNATDTWAEQLDEWKADALEARHMVLDGGFRVEDDESNKQASGLLVEVARRAKQVEALRVEAVGPMTKEVRRINAAFKACSDALDAVTARLKALTGEWALRKRQEQQRLLQEAQAAAEAQRVTDPDHVDLKRAAELVEAAKHAAPARLDGIGMRDVWRIEVTDPDLVPRDFCSPDLAKLKAAVDGGARSIPGVRVVAEVQIIARAS